MEVRHLTKSSTFPTGSSQPAALGLLRCQGGRERVEAGLTRGHLCVACLPPVSYLQGMACWLHRIELLYRAH